MHDLEKDILVGSNDCFGRFVSTIEQFFGDLHNIID